MHNEAAASAILCVGCGGRRAQNWCASRGRWQKHISPAHSHTPCCIRCPALAGNSHKAQLPINCIRRFHCVAHALVFASLERRDLSRVYICACAQDQSAPRASLFTPTNTYMYPHWQTEEETMSRKRPLIVDDQQWCIGARGSLRKWKPGVDFERMSHWSQDRLFKEAFALSPLI